MHPFLGMYDGRGDIDGFRIRILHLKIHEKGPFYMQLKPNNTAKKPLNMGTIKISFYLIYIIYIYSSC